MSKYAAGKEVLSYCGKCKLTLTHIIVSMKDVNTIGKVECRTCKGTHAYKDPSSKTKKVRKKSSIPGGRSKSMSVNDLWTQELSKAKGKPKAYSIRESFEVGDLVDHKSFGPGIVQDHVDGKIEVLFQHEIKTLVHNK
ncbi:MAG: hypothetical protein KC478_11840 [Bacteriovoracaceae bacterium]|nr:hypothetical protein [Bacteriovoracaceae bacterium]